MVAIVGTVLKKLPCYVIPGSLSQVIGHGPYASGAVSMLASHSAMCDCFPSAAHMVEPLPDPRPPRVTGPSRRRNRGAFGGLVLRMPGSKSPGPCAATWMSLASGSWDLFVLIVLKELKSIRQPMRSDAHAMKTRHRAARRGAGCLFVYRAAFRGLRFFMSQGKGFSGTSPSARPRGSGSPHCGRPR